VSLPAPVGEGSGGAVGLILGSAGGAFNLNLRITALEDNGILKTISAPKVATIDNKEATIGQGVSIPFSQVSASGVNTTFVEAKLELKVTPHVSADGSILLKIKATNNAPNPQLTGANGQPSISKREAETEVLVKDGETTVIGGIYTRQTATQTREVPFLGKIPIDPEVRQGGDSGRPIVVARPESAAAQALRGIAEGLAARISVAALSGRNELPINIVE
jgi:type IV pilus assembly protein PilQ